MKNTIAAVFISFALLGCTDKKAQEKAALDDVINVHDKVMGADEQLMNNKLLLDSMVKHNSTANIKDSVHMYLNKVNMADSAMSTWMHNFDPDHTGKSDEETMAYMQSQKKEIMAIDSQINAAIAESNKYLIKMKMK
ncbi:MAG TPA: hypothetical protein VIM16_14425 [Mucilaginibacter sp.]|jgi:hypothetical protein